MSGGSHLEERGVAPWSGRRSVVTLLLVLAVATLWLAACGGTSGGEPTGAASAAPAAPGYTDVSPDKLAAMLKDKDFVFINTHIPYEGEIEQTDLFLPYDRAEELVSELPADKDARIVVYCRSDRMSRIAADAWANAGYTNILNLGGGFVAWEAAGYELLHLPQD